MKLTPKEVQHVADLARLELNDVEKKRYAKELSVIFDYVEMLNEVDTDGIEETCQVTGLEDVVREDYVVETTPEERKALIEQFPEKMGNLLKVKAVFEK